jgi:hypothetical protein
MIIFPWRMSAIASSMGTTAMFEYLFSVFGFRFLVTPASRRGVLSLTPDP